MQCKTIYNLFFLFFFIVYLSTHVAAQKTKQIKIGIFHGSKITSVYFNGIKGKYDVIADNQTLVNDDSNLNLQLTLKPMGIELKNQNSVLGVFTDVLINSTDTLSTLNIKLNSSAANYYFDGEFKVSKSGNNMKIINMPGLEDYVTSVVESEAGNTVSLEYLKLQAILCRTFTGKNIGKHATEGFDLCDKVHCQVYKSKKRDKPLILEAVRLTKGKIIVDNNKKIILSAYHSNCGGQTINSEDVWNTPLPYLRAVKDTFCQSQPNAIWKHKIPLKDWEYKYSVKTETVVKDTFNQECYNYTPKGRECVIPYKGADLHLKKIRTDWNLKSTYFAIREKKDTLFFTGRGYGHGVGLCQEGAMKMVNLGYRYDQILKYYYKGISITFVDSIFH